MFVYITENTINGKKYIGMCTREDTGYLGSGALLKNAIEKYGKHNFKRTIIQTCDTFEELCDAEKYWIDYYDAVNSDRYYNLIEGGLGGNSERLKDYWQSLTPDQRKVVRNWKPHFANGGGKGANNYWYGKSTSANVKKVWDDRPPERKAEIMRKVNDTRKKNGSSAGINNNMYGSSAIREQNLRWYTNGSETIYVTEGTQPEGFVRGRKYVKK